jgi:hypothetical protein
VPTVRLVNPKASRVRRVRRRQLPRRNAKGRFLRRKRGRNPAAGGGELLLMNPKRRRVRSRARASHHKRRYRRRRPNPMSYAMSHPVRRRRRSHNPKMRVVRRRRHHNPLALGGRDLVPTALWAIAGGVATRAIPQLLMKENNTGLIGYGANALTFIIGSYAADRFISRNAAVGVLVGGGVMLAGRMISDYFGKTLVSFGDVFGTTGTAGMGAHGDPSFDLGLYTEGEFVVPTWSDGVMQRQHYPFWAPLAGGPQIPGVAPPAGVKAMPATRGSAVDASGPLAGMGMMTTGRFQSRFAA